MEESFCRSGAEVLGEDTRPNDPDQIGHDGYGEDEESDAIFVSHRRDEKHCIGEANSQQGHERTKATARIDDFEGDVGKGHNIALADNEDAQGLHDGYRNLGDEEFQGKGHGVVKNGRNGDHQDQIGNGAGEQRHDRPAIPVDDAAGEYNDEGKALREVFARQPAEKEHDQSADNTKKTPGIWRHGLGGETVSPLPNEIGGNDRDDKSMGVVFIVGPSGFSVDNGTQACLG